MLLIAKSEYALACDIVSQRSPFARLLLFAVLIYLSRDELHTAVCWPLAQSGSLALPWRLRASWCVISATSCASLNVDLADGACQPQAAPGQHS